MSKVFNITNATVVAALDMFRTLAIVSSATENQKKTTYLQVINKPVLCKLFKDFRGIIFPEISEIWNKRFLKTILLIHLKL